MYSIVYNPAHFFSIGICVIGRSCLLTRRYLADPSPDRTSDRVASELRKRIITLELPPAAVVSETYLAKLLDCSRTPLREALCRLANEYLVVLLPRRGVAIADLSVTDLSQVQDAMAELQTAMVDQIAERVTEEDIEALEAIVARAEEANSQQDFWGVVQADMAFHITIASLAGNPFIHDAVERLHRFATRYTYLATKKLGTAEDSLVEHRELIALLRSRDIDKLAAYIQFHAQTAKRRILKAL